MTSAELFNPANGTWTATGSLNTGREHHTATLLPNGQVLVAGGFNSTSGDLASAELFNPASGTWTATGSLNTGRDLHTATLLPDGQVLVAGGANSNSGLPLTSAELFNPANGTWTVTGSLNTARDYHTAALLPNGQVLVAGGFNFTSGDLTSAELIQSRQRDLDSDERPEHRANLSHRHALAQWPGAGSGGYQSVRCFDQRRTLRPEPGAGLVFGDG